MTINLTELERLAREHLGTMPSVSMNPQTVLALIRCARAAVEHSRWLRNVHDKPNTDAELHNAARDFEL